MKCLFSIFILLSLFFLGCSSAPETIIKDRVITVVPPAIHDTVRVTEAGDSVIVASKVVEHDTVAVIKYFPKLKYVDYRIKPDTIRIHDIDTVKQTVIKKEETPLLSKLGIAFVGALVVIALFIIKRYLK